MMRMILIVAVLALFCEAVAAGQNDAYPPNVEMTRAVWGLESYTGGANAGNGSPETVSSLGGSFPSGQAAGTTTKTKKSKPRPKPVSDSQMPTIQSVKVGYIDGAIIGSQIRIRFDAAFHDNATDRAEFFYPRYNGLNNNGLNSGPGPTSVLTDLNFQQLYLYAEYAPSNRFSIFTEVPVRWIQPQHTAAKVNGTALTNVNEAGLSDLAAGFKLAVVASSIQYLTFQFKSYFPSGNASLGLGTNHYSVEPALLYHRRLSERLALEAQVGDSHPIGGSFCPQPCVADFLPNGAPPLAPPPVSGGFAGDVFFYGAGPSYVLYRGEHVGIAPVVELIGWRILGGLETSCVPGKMLDGTVNPCLNQEGASADGTNTVNLKVGARTSIGRHNSLYVGFGHTVTHSHWYEEIVRAEYRRSF
jgi:hypothetical protein